MAHYTGLIDRFRDLLPVAADTRAISLNEGATPLIELRNLPVLVRKKVAIYAKFEGANPTGSFKDRGMTLAVTQAVEEGARAIICASTGNTSASAAAYAARAGIACFVLIPEGKIALGKLSQAMMHGSVVIQIRGNFDEGMRLVQEIASTLPVKIVNSINPYRIQGQKTVAFEVIEALGDAPDYHALPVGNAGNITAHWIGYSEAAGESTQALRVDPAMRKYRTQKSLEHRPIMVGYQASGAAPIIRGRPVENPETVATAIRIGDPASWTKAIEARDGTHGRISAVTDEEILKRCVYALINEGAKILEEGFALRASDIDIIYIYGYGFPVHRGGPMFYADTVGPAGVYDDVCAFQKQHGELWQPAPLLERLAREGKRFEAKPQA